ncbi:MAG: ABC transporter permease [Bryobacterales bacterium]|nr:ABC transporter permease [Bryobacterales bacterium]
MLGGVFYRVRGLLQRKRAEQELDDELRFHLEKLTEQHIDRGIPPGEAARLARVRLGGLAMVNEDCRESWGFGRTQALIADITYGLRKLRKSPVFTSTAICVLALSIGGATLFFALLRSVLLAPLPYRSSEELVVLSLDNPATGTFDQRFTVRRVDHTRDHAKSFSAVGVFLKWPEVMTLSSGGAPEALVAARVSSNLLGIMRAQPILGRDFVPEEDHPSGGSAVILSEGLWKRRFGADPQLTGQVLLLDSQPHTVVGVLPEAFDFPFPEVDVWVTHPSHTSQMPAKFWRFVTTQDVIARLKTGTTLAQAQSEMDSLNQSYVSRHPNALDAKPGVTVRVQPLKSRVVGSVRPVLWILFGAVCVLLLIACTNVSGLLLTRASARSHEFATLAALGAGPVRLVSRLFVESSTVVVLSGGIAVILAAGVTGVLPRLHMPHLPRSDEIQLDVGVFVFAVGVAALTCLVVGFFPALEVARCRIASLLTGHASSANQLSTMWRKRLTGFAMQERLVVGQVILSFVLMFGAGLLVQSFARLQSVDLGFNPERLLTLRVPLPTTSYNTREKRAVFFRELDRRLSSVPTIDDSALMRSIPTTPPLFTNIHVVGRDPVPEWEEPMARLQSITKGYFATMGISVRRGRAFADSDNRSQTPTVVINESFARQFWPAYPAGPDPVGQHLRLAFDGIASAEIIGIVKDVQASGPAEPADPSFYVPIEFSPPEKCFVALRTSLSTQTSVGLVTEVLHEVDPDLAIFEVKTMTELLDEVLGLQRLATALLVAFGILSLLLAVVGLYGVVGQLVQVRASEIGIRMGIIKVG